MRDGTVLLVLSDRDIAPQRLPVPAPMAVGAIQTRLVEKSLRCDANIIVETASARDPHHFAVLLGFGATAIYPYLAYETLAKLVDNQAIDKQYREVILNYRNGINKGLYKIMSKMGISTIASYRCSKLFEAVGLHRDLTNLCFQGVVSRIGGASFSDFQQDLQNLSKRAWLKRMPLEQGGLLKFVHGGEYHAYNPDVVSMLQKSVHSGKYSDYKAYATLVNQRPVAMLRALLTITPQGEAIPVDQVEPAESLFKRFDTAAMSIGGLLTFGIPAFKLEKAVMIKRHGIFSEMGIEFQLIPRWARTSAWKHCSTSLTRCFWALALISRCAVGWKTKQHPACTTR